jgi:hypothetical protein
MITSPCGILQKRHLFLKRYEKVWILGESTRRARDVDIPFNYLSIVDPFSQRIKFFEVIAMHHGRDGNWDALFPRCFYPTHGLLEGSRPPKPLMPFLEAI